MQNAGNRTAFRLAFPRDISIKCLTQLQGEHIRQANHIMDKVWLNRCRDEDMPIPPFDRYIYMLPEHVVKKRLVEGELGFDGHEPDLSTLQSRDDNEIKAMELVGKYTTIPIPKLIYQGDG